jgi:hypothetical protein
MIKLNRDDMMESVSEGIRRGIWDLATNQNPRVDVPNELLFDAIRQGVRDAMWQMITNATGMPCADFYQAIENGAAEGIARIAPDR